MMTPQDWTYKIFFGDNDPDNQRAVELRRPKVLTISWDEMVRGIAQIQAEAVESLRQPGVTVMPKSQDDGGTNQSPPGKY